MQEVQSAEDIPTFATEAEEAEFWATHSLGDSFLDHMGPIAEGILPPPQQPFRTVSIRVDEGLLRRIKLLAKARSTEYRSLLREFVLERRYKPGKGKTSRYFSTTWRRRSRGERLTFGNLSMRWNGRVA